MLSIFAKVINIAKVMKLMVVSFYGRTLTDFIKMDEKLFYHSAVLFLPKFDCCYLKIAKFIA
jgi:hypothetical protein